MLVTSSPSFGATPVHIPPNFGFIPNQGQLPQEVLYYGAVPGGAVYLTRTAIVLDTWESKRVTQDELDSSVRRTGRAVWIQFSGSNPSSAPAGEGPLKSRVNLFIGKTSSQWRTAIPLFSRTTYPDLWPGVSLTLAPNASGLACTLNLGANPDLAQFTIDRGDGIAPSRISLAELSELLATGGSGPEEVNHSNALLWSTYLGGSAEELGWSTAIDSFGNIIVVGLNTSTFFPTVPGSYDTVYSGLGDVFVSKLSADGSTLLWSTFLGGSSDFLDYGYAVKLDADNNPIVTGYTRSYDFPVTIGAWDTVYEDGEFGRTAADVFVTKLHADGRALIWSTYLGDVGHDIGYDVDFDASGAVVVAGRTISENFPTTFGAYDMSANGEEDGFITALSADGETLIWSTLLGGSLYDGVQAIRLDSSASSVVVGYTSSPDFPEGLTANGLYDIFVAKVSSNGNVLEWSRLVGGSNYDYGTDLVLDSRGNPIICGSTGSSDFPVTPGAYDESYNDDDDVIVAKYQGTNGDPLWATFIGGTTPVYEIAHGITLGVGDRPIVAGTTPSPDFPTTPDGYDRTHNGGGDVFVLRLNPEGSELEWSSFFGGPGEDYAYELTKGPTGSVVVTGQCDNGYPVTDGAYDAEYNGDIADVFVSRIALNTTEQNPGNGGAGAGGSALRISPNPVASSTRIAFTLPAPAATKIELFDVQGRLRASIDKGQLTAGDHSLDWNALEVSEHSLPSGVYAVRVTAGDFVQTGRVVLLR
jgi:hypothetical protein